MIYKKLIWLYALFLAIRLSTGAINVIYLLSMGVNLNWIMFFNIVFSVSSMLYPLIIIKYNNNLSPKMITLSSIAFSILYALLTILAPDKTALFLSQLFYGFSLSGMEIGYYAWLSSALANSYVDQKDLQFKTNQYSHKGSKIGFFLTMFSASMLPISFTYYEINLRYSFLLVAICFIALFIYVLKIKDIKAIENIEREPQQKDDKITNYYKIDKIIILSALSLTASSFAIVPIYHLWQILFKEKFNLTLDSSNLIYILSLINLGVFGSQSLLNKVPQRFYKSSFLIPIIYSLITFIAIQFMLRINNNYYVIFAYFIVHGAYSVSFIGLKNYTLSKYPRDNKQILSIFHICSLIGSIGALLFLIFFINNNNIVLIYKYTSIAFFITAIFMIIAYFYDKKTYLKEINLYQK